jgi:5,6-dimethylbenzimidazole synthase
MTPIHEFQPVQKRAVYDAIALRRDIRSFKPDPIAPEVLARILRAAHQAGSVGFMQPWNFILVRNAEKRRAIWEHVNAERLAAATAFEGERRAKYLSFKLEGILDAPLNICVTCDPTRHGPEVLGRHTIRQTDVYSTCCAIQNLWLAARIEGIGVGWVSILRNEFMNETLGIPAHIIPVAYLCLGYPTSFATQPMLEKEGWLARLPLSQLVQEDSWGGALSPEFGRVLDQDLNRPNAGS